MHSDKKNQVTLSIDGMNAMQAAPHAAQSEDYIIQMNKDLRSEIESVKDKFREVTMEKDELEEQTDRDDKSISFLRLLAKNQRIIITDSENLYGSYESIANKSVSFAQRIVKQRKVFAIFPKVSLCVMALLFWYEMYNLISTGDIMHICYLVMFMSPVTSLMGFVYMMQMNIISARGIIQRLEFNKSSHDMWKKNIDEIKKSDDYVERCIDNA